MNDQNRTLENELANQITALEAKIRELVTGTPAESELTEGQTARERTRGVATRRLGSAVQTLRSMSDGEPALRGVAREAAARWEKCQHLAWTLAMTAKHVADQEARRYARTEAMKDDLQQAGFVGLLRAARRYEPSKGVRFTTYARWWVQAEIKDALNRTKLVRIPGNAEHLRQKLRAELEAQVQRDEPVSVERAARALGVDLDVARHLLSLEPPRSLDQSWGDEEGRLGHEAVPDTDLPAPDEVVARLEVIEHVNEAVDTLADRDAFVVRNRHGIGPGLDEARTLADIGEQLGVSAQRVRQLQKRGERRIREQLVAEQGLQSP